MLLTDIAVEHTLVSKKNGVRQTFSLRIGKRMQQISLTNPILFGHPRVLDGDIS